MSKLGRWCAWWNSATMRKQAIVAHLILYGIFFLLALIGWIIKLVA